MIVERMMIIVATSAFELTRGRSDFVHFDHIIPDIVDPGFESHRLVGELSRSMVDPGRHGVALVVRWSIPVVRRHVVGETALECVAAVAVEAVLLEGLRGQGDA